MPENIIKFIRDIYETKEFIPLHKPSFTNVDSEYVLNTLKTGFVSTVGKYVDEFETKLESYTACEKAIATVNGTASIQAALFSSGAQYGDIVLTQALTFVASCNVLKHMGITPAFIDVSMVSLGMCPHNLSDFLDKNAKINPKGECVYKKTGQRIHSVLPMHTFGHPVELDEILEICQSWNLILIEDSAESLGSFYKGKHTGTIGDFGVLSFNGNKIITTGGGGAILCKTQKSGLHLKHITTTAKVPHEFEYYHDELGFNYRMPNLNAALGCSQMESLQTYLVKKRKLADLYEEYFRLTAFEFVTEPVYAKSNYWLNAIICPDSVSRNKVLNETNEAGVMTRPVWKLMHKLPAFKDSIYDDLSVSENLENRLLNLPSTPF